MSNKQINPTGNSPLWFWLKVGAPAGYFVKLHQERTMTDDERRFLIKWFREPLTQLYSNHDAGFIILMASLPLLERYLREKSGIGDDRLNSKGNIFYTRLIDLFPSLKDIPTATLIWDLLRNGLLHQGTIKTVAGNAIIEMGVKDSAADIEITGYSAAGITVTISPSKFSEKVIAKMEQDWGTSKLPGSKTYPIPIVNPQTGSSGWHK